MRKGDIDSYEPVNAAPSVIAAGDLARDFLLSKGFHFIKNKFVYLFVYCNLVINGHLSALRAPFMSRLLTWQPRRTLFQEFVSKFARSNYFTHDATRMSDSKSKFFL